MIAAFVDYLIKHLNLESCALLNCCYQCRMDIQSNWF